MLKKVVGILAIIVLLVAGTITVSGAELKTRLDVMQQESQAKQLENTQGFLSSKITSSDSEKGEVTVNVTLENIKEKTSAEKERYDTNEIFIIIPEYTNAAENEKLTHIETLASKIFEKNSKTKIGVIGIQGPIADTYFDEEGKLQHKEDDQSDVNGTENNAECIVELTDNLDTIKSKLRSMNSEKKVYYGNFQAALRLARKSFSNNTNKILVSLFDNVPHTSIGTMDLGPSYGGFFSDYNTAEEAARAHLDKLVSNTKSEILALKSANINFILLRPDDTSFDRKFYKSDTGELTCEIDGKPYADELYGTLEKPTYGKMYSLNNDSLEKIVTEYIYNDVMQFTQPEMKNVVVKTYLPKDIIDNFDVAISEANSTNTDASKINTDRLITWNIGNLGGNKTANLEFTLKIKDMKNSSIIDKELPVNEKLELSYVDYNETSKTATLTDSPKIQLTQIKEEEKPNNTGTPSTNNNQQNKVDPTVANKALPQTGENVAIIGIIAILVIGGVLYYIKVRKYKDIK